jgi:hypothetical protein
MLLVFLSLLLLVQAPRVAPDSTIVAAVRVAAEHEPVEAFGNLPGVVRVRDIVLLDVDGDGVPEAFVWIEPRVRQTPTILAYAFDSQRGARRLLEGLVPGSPQPVSGRLVDDHTMGFGIDMTVAKQSDFDILVASGVQHHMSVVGYRTFAHADGRSNFITMVDLSIWKLPSNTKTCESFEFDPVEALATGRLGDTGQGYLVALTPKDVTIYRFRGIRSNGLFDKESWVRPRPPNVVGLAVSAGGGVRLRTQGGEVVAVAEP